MKDLLRVFGMTALVVALMLASVACVGATLSSEAPAPPHFPSATPGPNPMQGLRP
jgi:hypothetical protein